MVRWLQKARINTGELIYTYYVRGVLLGSLWNVRYKTGSLYPWSKPHSTLSKIQSYECFVYKQSIFGQSANGRRGIVLSFQLYITSQIQMWRQLLACMWWRWSWARHIALLAGSPCWAGDSSSLKMTVLWWAPATVTLPWSLWSVQYAASSWDCSRDWIQPGEE